MFTYEIETWKKMSKKMIETQWKDLSFWKNVGFQVVIYTHENEDRLELALESVEAAMLNFDKDCKWIFQIGDGDSEDKTLEKIAKHAKKTSADKIHLYDFNEEEKRAVNENKLIKELHRYGEEYPAVLFMEAGGLMRLERPMMYYTAAAYNATYVVGGWASGSRGTNSLFDSDEAAYKLYFGPWATLFHISALPEDGKFFYENINKGRDVLTWTQLRHIKNINPVPHVRAEELVHVYMQSDEPIVPTYVDAIFKQQEVDDIGLKLGLEHVGSGHVNPSIRSLKLPDTAKEGEEFLKMKSRLESKCDILKHVERT